MTTLMNKPAAVSSAAPWSTMPGWGIVANLTPPEVVAQRELRGTRRAIAYGLALVLIVCVGLYVWAAMQNSSAADKADRASQQVTQLQASANQYSNVTQLEAGIQQIAGQAATLLNTDIDTSGLVRSLLGALPATASISNLSISFQSSSTDTSTTAVPTTGAAPIGLVTITGAGRSLDDAANFAENLQQLKGVTQVMPGTNSMQGSVSQFGLTLSITDQLYSHHFDVKAGN